MEMAMATSQMPLDKPGLHPWEGGWAASHACLPIRPQRTQQPKARNLTLELHHHQLELRPLGEQAQRGAYSMMGLGVDGFVGLSIEN